MGLIMHCKHDLQCEITSMHSYLYISIYFLQIHSFYHRMSGASNFDLPFFDYQNLPHRVKS